MKPSATPTASDSAPNAQRNRQIKQTLYSLLLIVLSTLIGLQATYAADSDVVDTIKQVVAPDAASDKSDDAQAATEDESAATADDKSEEDAESAEADRADDSSTDTPRNAPAPGNLTETEGVIATSSDKIDDGDIKERITGIFSEIEGLKTITVTVNQGVVSLSGDVPNEKKAQQAIKLANRVSDVVAVEDRISRTLDVQDNVTPVVEDLIQQFRNFVQALPLLLVAIIVFALVVWFGSWLSRRNSLWSRVTPNPFVAELLSQTVKVLFIIIALILALSLLGAEAIIGTLLGGAGVIGIAVGFAVKDTIENYIASLMLSIRQPFMARDFVRINDKEGIVVRLTSRATILMTPDGNQLRVPNSEVFKATILNYTKNPERRFEFKLGIDANDDPLAAIKVGLDAVNELEFVLETPKAVCIITEVGDSNIVLEFQVWVDQTDTDLLKARSIAIRETKHALENNGFSLPEPIYRMRFNGDVEDAIKHLKGVDTSTSEVVVDTVAEEDNASKEGHVATHTNKAQSESKADRLDKEEAKQRAKMILGDKHPKEVLDARPDPKLMQKVEQEIQENTGDTDLLSHNSPQE